MSMCKNGYRQNTVRTCDNVKYADELVFMRGDENRHCRMRHDAADLSCRCPVYISKVNIQLQK